MRAQPFRQQQRTGRVGETYIKSLFPNLKWVSEDPDESTPYDFLDESGNKIELKTCKTYPNIYINHKIYKEGVWKVYGPGLAEKNKVDYIWWLFLDRNNKPFKLIQTRTKSIVRNLRKSSYAYPFHKDSNKETKIYDINEVTSYMKKGYSWMEIPLTEQEPFSVILSAEQAQDRALWLSARSQGVGCSDVYTLFGKSKWKTPNQLLDEKVFGLKQEITDPKTLHKFWMGHAMEPVLTNWWNAFKKEELGKAEEWQALLKSNLVSGLVGTPDAKTEKALIEYKTTNPYTYKKSWISGSRVPEHYYYQVQAQILLTGIQTCHVVVARAIEHPPRILTVEKDQKVVDNIAYKVENFWKRVKELKERIQGESQ